MDVLGMHEAFLRAIFDTPDDDTARLVYADFLQENGEEDRAELIRVQCELSADIAEMNEPRKTILAGRAKTLSDKVVPWNERAFTHGCRVSRGFWHEEVYGGIELAAEHLADTVAWRWTIVRTFPSWFGEKRVALRSGSRILPEQLDVVFGLPFLQQVTEWNLGGHVVDLSTAPIVDEIDGLEFLPRLTGFNTYPVITSAGVSILARHRAARRIVSLDLRNNNLDNDAARALVKSPYLDNLKRLQLLEGNRLRGRVWQQVIERFGEDVVG